MGTLCRKSFVESNMLNAVRKLVRTLFADATPEAKVAQASEDHFITLMTIAGEDEAIRLQLISILTLDSFDRISSLNTWIDEMRLAQAPRPLIDSLAYLLDDGTANRALALLNKVDG